MEIGTFLFMMIVFTYLTLGLVFSVVVMVLTVVNEIKGINPKMNHWNYVVAIIASAPMLNLIFLSWYLSEANRPEWMVKFKDLERF